MRLGWGGFAPNDQFTPINWGTQPTFIICYFYTNLNYNETIFTIKKLRDIFREDFIQPPNLYGMRVPNHHNIAINREKYKGWGHWGRLLKKDKLKSWLSNYN